MNPQTSLADRLRLAIHEHLDRCDSGHTPGICSQIQTPAGYRRIEGMIIDMAVSEGISIGAAITAIETEFE